MQQQASAPPRSLCNQRASWIAPRARTHAHTCTQAPCPRVPAISASQSNPHACVHAVRWKQLWMACPRDWAVAGSSSTPAPRGRQGARAAQKVDRHSSKMNVSTVTAGVQGRHQVPGGGPCAPELVQKTEQRDSKPEWQWAPRSPSIQQEPNGSQNQRAFGPTKTARNDAKILS